MLEGKRHTPFKLLTVLHYTFFNRNQKKGKLFRPNVLNRLPELSNICAL